MVVPPLPADSPDQEMLNFSEGRGPWLIRIVLLKCPVCNGAIVTEQAFLETDGDDNPIWTKPERAWPAPENRLDFAIPSRIRASLEEAEKCLAAGAFTASVVMSGRVIETMCGHFKTKVTSLFEGLKELHDREVIDARLYAWGDELRKHRNLAAYAGDAKFSAEDARDLCDFAKAICEYIFVLQERFENFKKRRLRQVTPLHAGGQRVQ